jgi:hypothetical protein
MCRRLMAHARSTAIHSLRCSAFGRLHAGLRGLRCLCGRYVLIAGVSGVVQMMNTDRLNPRYRDQGNPAMTVLLIMAIVMVAFLGIPTGMYLMNQRKNPRKPKVHPSPAPSRAVLTR